MLKALILFLENFKFRGWLPSNSCEIMYYLNDKAWLSFYIPHIILSKYGNTLCWPGIGNTCSDLKAMLKIS